MAITCQRLLTEMGDRAWSGFNRDDMVFGQEDARTAQAELNVALRYLMNLDDFPFKAEEMEITTRPNGKEYSAPDGQIDRIYNLENLKELKFIGNADDLDTSKVGTPTSYYIDYSNPDQSLKLYPTPDKRAKYKVVYNTLKPVMDKDGATLKFEFENAEDTINLPDSIAHLFMDCLVLRTMVTNNKDEQDENYRPTINEFYEHWRLFKKECKSADTQTYFYF
ncbi:MAG: hypothetical protein IKY15_00155 [Clostridia bacterium]|nr:hypothetical protein [Clostridia bacterium]